MNEQQPETKPPANPFADLLKMSTDFWTAFSTLSPPLAKAYPATPGGTPSRGQETLERMEKIMQSLSATMNDPEAAEAAFKGASALPEIFMKMAQTGWDAAYEIQKRAVERAGKIGQRTEAYNFDQIDQEMFKAWREIYEQEFSQFLKVPPLGLTRYYQERFNHLLDRQNVFQTALSEFLYILYLPVEKSQKVLQDQVEEMAKEGKVPKKSKEYYNIWMKTLEGHYLTLFQTPEYLKALREMLLHYNNLVSARDDVMRDILQILPVPTHREMDEVYKDLHLLKKRVRTLEDKLKQKKG